MNSELKIGQLYCLFFKSSFSFAPVVYHPTNNWEAVEIIEKLFSNQIFLLIEIKYETHIDSSHNRIWLKILLKNFIGWIKISPHDIKEFTY